MIKDLCNEVIAYELFLGLTSILWHMIFPFILDISSRPHTNMYLCSLRALMTLFNFGDRYFFDSQYFFQVECFEWRLFLFYHGFWPSSQFFLSQLLVNIVHVVARNIYLFVSFHVVLLTPEPTFNDISILFILIGYRTLTTCVI